ncbi:ubiquitin carboxyl-terminal hydrolase 47-like [Thunnus thynnus]|uniref:ubiquitin carboxyl-terminal hydrolase 47-like n=1 Tax=Thunnus thynnus TaxID=8237 RepID=UPI0035288E7F
MSEDFDGENDPLNPQEKTNQKQQNEETEETQRGAAPTVRRSAMSRLRSSFSKHHGTSLTDSAAERQNDTSHEDGELIQVKVDDKRKVGETDSDDEEKTQTGHSDDTQPQRRHYGLYNQGATSHLNSVLQVLFMTTEITDGLDPKSKTDRQLKNMFEKLEKTTCGTKTITDTFGFKNRQSDAAECLEMILRKISQQASKAFKGELTVGIKCSRGHIINEETNPFWTLPLSLSKDPLDTNYSVERGFEGTFQSKSFSGDNMVYCKECKKKTEATKGCEMVKFPQILTLLLKRFDFDYNTMSHVKSDCCVHVSRTLQIKNKKYELYGVVNHMGSLRGGHYTATIRPNGEETWYEFNDDYVNKVEEPSNERSRTAYLLMYRATKCKMPIETNSEDLDDKVKEQQDEDMNTKQQKDDEEKEQQDEDMNTKQQKEDEGKEEQDEDMNTKRQKEDEEKQQQDEDMNTKQQKDDEEKEQDEDMNTKQQKDDEEKEQQDEDMNTKQ